MSVPRRSIALLLLAVAATAPLGAQRPARFSGVTGGATLSDITGGFSSNKDQWGGTAGIFFGSRMSRNTLLVFEGNWTQKGGGDYRLDYLEIPMLLGALTTTGDGSFARVYSGITVGFKLKCNGPETGSLCDSMNGTEWAWPIGIQLGKGLADRKFVALDVRYALGLSNVVPTAYSVNRSWQFRLLLGTPLGN